MHDDELLAAIATTLSESTPEPDSDRIDAIRAAAAARRAASDDGTTPSAPSAPSEVTPLHSRRQGTEVQPKRSFRLLAVAAAVVAFTVAGSVIFMAVNDGDDGEIEYAGSITGSGGTAELTVTKTGIGRVVELDTDELPILPTGELYQVWFVGPGDTPTSPNRISAGTFHPDPEGRSNVTFAAAVDPTLFPIVQITSEPGDGDPSPSQTVVLETEI